MAEKRTAIGFARQTVEIAQAGLGLGTADVQMTTDGLAWWPLGHEQRISVQPGLAYAGEQLARVDVRTRVAKGLQEEPAGSAALADDESTAVVASRSPEKTTSALVFPNPTAVCLHSHCYVTAKSAATMGDLIADLAVMQCLAVPGLVSFFRERLRAIPDKELARAQPLPAALRRTARRIKEQSEWLSRWQSDEQLAEVAKHLRAAGAAERTEPCGVQATVKRGETIIGRIELRTDWVHRTAGRGVLVTLEVTPLHTPASEKGGGTEQLNNTELELFSPVHFVGGWSYRECRRNQVSPLFVCFLPNAVYRPGLLEAVALSMVARARDIDGRFGDEAGTAGRGATPPPPRLRVISGGRPLAAEAADDDGRERSKPFQLIEGNRAATGDPALRALEWPIVPSTAKATSRELADRTYRRILERIRRVVAVWSPHASVPGLRVPAEPVELDSLIEGISTKSLECLQREEQRALGPLLRRARLLSMHWGAGPESWHVYVGALTLPNGERVYLQNDSTDDYSPGFLLAAADPGRAPADMDEGFLAAHIASNGNELGCGLMGGWPSSVTCVDFRNPVVLVDAFIAAVGHPTFTDDELVELGWRSGFSRKKKRQMMAELLELTLPNSGGGKPSVG